MANDPQSREKETGELLSHGQRQAKNGWSQRHGRTFLAYRQQFPEVPSSASPVWSQWHGFIPQPC